MRSRRRDREKERRREGETEGLGKRETERKFVSPSLRLSFSLSLRLFVLSLFISLIANAQTGEITGRVVADDGEGLANVMVYLNVVGARSGVPRETATDENGKFRFSDLNQNEYSISMADFGGYVRTPSSEAERQRPRYYRIGDDVTVTMIRGGVITGRVTNANGEPVIAVAVTAVKVRDVEGAPARGGYPSRPRFTNDRGVYRIYGLTPGTYVVAANRRDNNFRPSPAPYDDELPAYHPEAMTRADPKAAEDVLRYSETIARSEGAFAFNNIAPGKYLLLTRVVPDDEPIDRAPFPAAWDANERAKLRKEAEAMKVEIELKPCQRVTDQVVKYVRRQ
jgi:Carboxypeptidase regulatory-like domain